MSIATVVGVHRNPEHSFSKESVDSIEVLAGLGVVGDAHAGPTVKHRSRVAADPNQPNLRQVHLMHREVFDVVAEKGHAVAPGDLGENITTEGLDLLDLPVGTTLSIGDAVLVMTGLRNPCGQINGFSAGLLEEMVHRNSDGEIERLAGAMSMVVKSGTIRVGDEIRVARPAPPHHPMVRI